MHHPDLYQVLLTIDDYFLLKNNTSNYKIEAIIEQNQKEQYIRRGLGIKCDLNNGYIYISIIGQESGAGEEDNTLTCQYFIRQNSLELIKKIEVKHSDYSIENARYAIREIMKMDKEYSSNAG
jgi:hypothetical protein